jgi:hypothetical protein
MTALTETRASQHAPERATPARAAATPTARGYPPGTDDYQRRLRKIRASAQTNLPQAATCARAAR